MIRNKTRVRSKIDCKIECYHLVLIFSKKKKSEKKTSRLMSARSQRGALDGELAKV